MTRWSNDCATARFVRSETIRLIEIAKAAHYSSVFSAAEIFAALYYDVMVGVRLARKCGAKIVALTSSSASLLAQEADIMLCTPARDSPLMGQMPPRASRSLPCSTRRSRPSPGRVSTWSRSTCARRRRRRKPPTRKRTAAPVRSPRGRTTHQRESRNEFQLPLTATVSG